MVFNLVAYLIVLAVSSLVSYLLRPDPPEGPEADHNIRLPEVSQGTPYRIIFGRPPRIRGNMILWYGGLYLHYVKLHGQRIGYNYHCGMHMGLSHGYVDGVVQMWVDDRCFWPILDAGGSFDNDGTTTFDISQWGIWGGRSGRGGIHLLGDILYGKSDQAQNLTLMQNQAGSSTPYYRGITSVVFNTEAYWGMSPNFPAIDFTLKRTDLQHDGTQMWYLAKAVVDTAKNLNVVHALRECLTSTIFGRGLADGDMDSTTFEAAADTCYGEGLGISYSFVPSESSVASFIKKLEEIMDGFVYFDHGTGTYKVKLIRNDYVVASLTTYDEDDFNIETFSRPSYYQVPSETIVKYTDILSGKSAIAKDDDLAIMSIQGESPIPQTFNWPMIAKQSIAADLASREQDQISRMPAFLRLSTTRSMYGITRGDVFKLSHPRLTNGGVTTMTVRVVTINRGELDDGKLYIDVSEEIFEPIVQLRGQAGSTLVSTPTGVAAGALNDGYYENISFSAGTMTVQLLSESQGSTLYEHMLVTADAMTVQLAYEYGGDYDPSADANCVLWAKMDSGALLTDSSGNGNTLTNASSVASETSDYKEGDGCGDFSPSTSSTLHRSNANLSNNVPFKSGGDGERQMTICAWSQIASLGATRCMASMYHTSSNRSWMFAHTTANLPGFWIGYNSGASAEAITYSTAVEANKWYHIAVTFDADTKAVRIRVWDNTAGALLAADTTGVFTNAIFTGTASLTIGRAGGLSTWYYPHGKFIDDVVIFNRVLDVTEIDAIRNQIFN